MYLSINTDLAINKVYLVQTKTGVINAKLISEGVSRFEAGQNAVSLNFETETGEMFNISDIAKVNEVV